MNRPSGHEVSDAHLFGFKMRRSSVYPGKYYAFFPSDIYKSHTA
jgi:hypothetical protein